MKLIMEQYGIAVVYMAVGGGICRALLWLIQQLSFL